MGVVGNQGRNHSTSLLLWSEALGKPIQKELKVNQKVTQVHKTFEGAQICNTNKGTIAVVRWAQKVRGLGMTIEKTYLKGRYSSMKPKVRHPKVYQTLADGVHLRCRTVESGV